MKRHLFASVLLCAGVLVACGGGASSSAEQTKPTVGTSLTVALLETTDMHVNVLGYDYFKLAADPSVGFERTATLIKNARAEFANSLLFDNGDAIQGTVMGDYQAMVQPIDCGTTEVMYKAMNSVGYDAAAVGNHEFNYGLAYLSQVSGSVLNVDPASGEKLPTGKCAGPSFPMVLANVVSAKDSKPLFQPYVILNRSFKATDPSGASVQVPLKVAVIGFAPPPILSWDKRWLDGKVTVADTVAVAQQYVNEVRAKGADVVVFLEHGGLDNSAYSPTMENMGYWLSRVQGVDAMMLGHTHQVFPNAKSTGGMYDMPGVDKVNGFVNGVPTVMANYWGKNLGVIKLQVKYGVNGWYVDRTTTTVESRSTKNADGTYVAPDPSIAALVNTEHQATIAYVKTPIGNSDFGMSTYFADVGDVTAIQVVNQAQADYVSSYIKANLPQYANLPVLSVSAPFKSGSAGATDYTDVAQGAVAINNAADLYLYANTVYAVKVTGADIRNWLEKSANRFNQIDPSKTNEQELVNSAFPGYNFDVFSTPDLSYQIDVTQPIGSRVVNLTYKGAPIDAGASFIVATNNYRASGGGNFPGLDGSKTVYASPDTNRDVLMAYIKKQGNLSRTSNGNARSWSFKKVATAGPVVFHSAQAKLGVAQADGIANISVYKTDDGLGKSTSSYQIDLSK